MAKVGVIGAGAWGTVVANVLAENGHQVRLWCYADTIANTIAHHRTHHRLPGATLSPHLEVTTHMADCYDVDWVVLGLSASQLTQYDASMAWSAWSMPVIALAKGLMEPDWFVSDWLRQRVSGPIGVLSGPNLALELAHQKPAATVIATTDAVLSKQVQDALSNGYLRCYTSDDMIGVQCGGIFKNVLAIAAGSLDALQLGDNAKAALITRGVVELQRVAQFFGANPDTIMGLSGLGDLMATCSSTQSRNWQLGHAMVTDPTGWECHDRGQTEGMRTIQLFYDHIVANDLNVPIMMSVGRLFRDPSASPQGMLADLMKRGLKSEF